MSKAKEENVNVQAVINDFLSEIKSSKKKVKLAPGEMENVVITTEMLKDMNKDSEIIVRVEE